MEQQHCWDPEGCLHADRWISSVHSTKHKQQYNSVVVVVSDDSSINKEFKNKEMPGTVRIVRNDVARQSQVSFSGNGAFRAAGKLTSVDHRENGNFK